MHPWDHRAHLRVAWLSNLCGDPHAGMGLTFERIRTAVAAGAGREGAECARGAGLERPRLQGSEKRRTSFTRVQRTVTSDTF